MKVLVTGANGFIGAHLIRLLRRKGHTPIATGRRTVPVLAEDDHTDYVVMDFTDPFAVHDVFEKIRPDAVVHAGAMSKPDVCEEHQWQAYLVNVEGTLNLLLNAQEYKSHFVFLSTDFVFDGDPAGKKMYREEEDRNPVNFYGRTKVEAEDAVREYPFDWTIVRTILVYGKAISGSNLLTTIREKLEAGETYNAVNDLVRTPTYVEDLATGIISILEKKATGVYHLSGTELLTPYKMARMTAEHLGLDLSLINKINAEELNHPARRPARTGFVIDKAKKELDFQPVSFREGLKRTFG